MGYRVDAYGVEDKLNLTQINVCGFFLQCSNCGGIKMKKGMPPDVVAQLSGSRGKSRSI